MDLFGGFSLLTWSPRSVFAVLLFTGLVLGPGLAIVPAGATGWAMVAGIFLLLLGYGTWAMLFHRGLPLAWRGLRRAWRYYPTRSLRLLFAIAALGALLLFPIHSTGQRSWLQPKWFDDVMAVSNAYKVLDQGLEPSQLYFRSFLRPSFTGLALPFARLDPLINPDVTFSPSDKYRRVWHIYHDGHLRGHNWGQGIYPHLSLALRGLAMALPLLVFGLLSALGIRPFLALAGGCLLLDWHMRSIDEILTQTHNLVLVVLMGCTVVGFLRGRPGVGRALVTGFGLAVGFLAIHSMVVAIVPLLAMILWRAHLRGWRLRNCAYLLAGAVGLVAPIMIWYEGYLRGFFFEITFFDVEQWETQNLMNYGLNSAKVMNWHLTVILGPAYYPVVLSALLLIPILIWGRNGGLVRRQGPILVVWLALSAGAIASQVFIFNRFFLYGLPALAWMLTLVVDQLGRWLALCGKREKPQLLP